MHVDNARRSRGRGGDDKPHINVELAAVAAAELVKSELAQFYFISSDFGLQLGQRCVRILYSSTAAVTSLSFVAPLFVLLSLITILQPFK